MSSGEFNHLRQQATSQPPYPIQASTSGDGSAHTPVLIRHNQHQTSVEQGSRDGQQATTQPPYPIQASTSGDGSEVQHHMHQCPEFDSKYQVSTVVQN